jgi:hypothetical protein
VRIGPLADRALRPGAWRELTVDEWRSLTEAVAATDRPDNTTGQSEAGDSTIDARD